MPSLKSIIARVINLPLELVEIIRLSPSFRISDACYKWRTKNATLYHEQPSLAFRRHGRRLGIYNTKFSAFITNSFRTILIYHGTDPKGSQNALGRKFAPLFQMVQDQCWSAIFHTSWWDWASHGDVLFPHTALSAAIRWKYPLGGSRHQKAISKLAASV
jgi:hypothetical protein